jgi:uncharacterized protein YbjQ (UPF0145 family)
MYLSTLPIYDTSLYVPGNLIISTDVQAVSGVRDVGAQIMGIFGGSSQLMDKKVKDVVQEAMGRFVKTAQTKGAQAAVGITTDVNAFVDKDQVYIIATITGTPLMSKASPALPIVPSAPTQQMLPKPVDAVPFTPAVMPIAAPAMPMATAPAAGGRRRRTPKRKTAKRR